MLENGSRTLVYKCSCLTPDGMKRSIYVTQHLLCTATPDGMKRSIYITQHLCRRAPLTIVTHATGGVDDRAVNVQMATTTREPDGGNPECSIKLKMTCWRHRPRPLKSGNRVFLHVAAGLKKNKISSIPNFSLSGKPTCITVAALRAEEDMASQPSQNEHQSSLNKN